MGTFFAGCGFVLLGIIAFSVFLVTCQEAADTDIPAFSVLAWLIGAATIVIFVIGAKFIWIAV